LFIAFIIFHSDFAVVFSFTAPSYVLAGGSGDREGDTDGEEKNAGNKGGEGERYISVSDTDGTY
jgi:hypothetical protein